MILHAYKTQLDVNNMKTGYVIRRKKGEPLEGYYWNGYVFLDDSLYSAKIYYNKENIQDTLQYGEEIAEVKISIREK